MEINKVINTYLCYGYLPPSEIPDWIDRCITSETKGDVYDNDEVIERLKLIFDQLVEHYDCKHHIVPLSGGWDSRLILGALLERVEASSIQTVTFGTPGQLDFEIAKKVASWAGVKHHSINLNDVPFTWRLILESVKKSKWTYVPDGYYNQICRNYIQAKEGNIVWVGFLGDPLFGSHLISDDLPIERAINGFLNKQIMSTDLIDYNHKEIISIEESTIQSNLKNLSLYDALDLGIRQAHCIYPIVTSDNEMKGWGTYFGEENGYKIVAPFADPKWAGYWLSAPRSKRIGMKLFHEAMEKKFPELFALPSKSKFGYRKNQIFRYQLRRTEYGIKRSLNKILPGINIGFQYMHNYLDYDKAYREREDFQNTLKKAFNYLEEIDATPWLDFGKLWNEHCIYKINNGRNFNILLGLAANLKANKNR